MKIAIPVISGITMAAIGFGVAYLYFNNKSNGSSTSNGNTDGAVIKLGDKSKDVELLQKVINQITISPVVEVTGTYDGLTKSAVNQIFQGTAVLKDVEMGAVDKGFIVSLAVAIDNSSGMTQGDSRLSVKEILDRTSFQQIIQSYIKKTV